MLDTGRVWVKISGPMRITAEEHPYPSVTPIAKALIKRAPDRLVWGSDWPHTLMWERTMPNDGDLIDLIGEWMPDEATRKKILVDNPAKLYSFQRGGFSRATMRCTASGPGRSRMYAASQGAGPASSVLSRARPIEALACPAALRRPPAYRLLFKFAAELAQLLFVRGAVIVRLADIIERVRLALMLRVRNFVYGRDLVERNA